MADEPPYEVLSKLIDELAAGVSVTVIVSVISVVITIMVVISLALLVVDKVETTELVSVNVFVVVPVLVEREVDERFPIEELHTMFAVDDS
jgi:hypothetical protein